MSYVDKNILGPLLHMQFNDQTKYQAHKHSCIHTGAADPWLQLCFKVSNNAKPCAKTYLSIAYKDLSEHCIIKHALPLKFLRLFYTSD